MERAEHDGVALGVAHGLAGGLVPVVDGQPPRQVGGAAVELVVEPVAPAAEGLGDRHPGRRGVGVVAEAHAVAPGAQPGAQRTEGDGAPDAEPALPDVERPDGAAAAAEVGLGRGDDVVDPAAEDAERHRPRRDVDGLLAGVAAVGEAPAGDPDGHDDAREDAHGVRPQGQRPEVPHPGGGAGDGGDHWLAACTAAFSDSGVRVPRSRSLPSRRTVGVPLTSSFSDWVCTDSTHWLCARSS